ncbi:PD-(D/E)XK nuclease family protein [Maricaulis sp.]|uniref:PDDEXK-like family protein n=1 Tax=Maricaulis sp. TaxID=1486257 RepID=UPI0032993081
MNQEALDDSREMLDELEGLFVNNPDLDRLRAYLGRFNPIKTMGMENMEIRHSAILAWLLNPQDTHGLGDSFLKAFLSEALRGVEALAKPSALEVSQADMMDAEIRREWRNIDMLVLSPRNGWVFVIENKFHSNQHTNQLERYLELAKEAFVDSEQYKIVRGVFLTLWDETPEDIRYAPIDYASVCELLDQQALSGRTPLTPEVETFIKHYLDVIREAASMSEEQTDMEKLARQLYQDHRRALDFVFEYGKATEFLVAVEGLFGHGLAYLDDFAVDKVDFVFGHANAQTASFLPFSWYEALGEDEFLWHGCENWWAGYPLNMWIQLTEDSDGRRGQIRLYSEVGPLTDHAFRRALIETIAEAAGDAGSERIKFQRGAAEEGKKYSKFLKKNIFPVDDIHDPDKISGAIRKALKSFKPEIDIIANVLPQFIGHGKTESS